MDLSRKLSSRKFWCALLAFLAPLLTSFNMTDEAVAQVILIVSGISALVIYILSEGAIDKADCRK